MVFVVLCPGTPEGSIGSGSGFKASQKTGPRFKVSSGLKSHPTDWEKPGIEPATPGLQDIGLSPTPRRLHTMLLFTAIFVYKVLCAVFLMFHIVKLIKIFET